MRDLAVVFLAASPGRKMRSFGPRSLLPLPDGRTVLRRQYDLAKQAYPKAQVMVAAGYEADRVAAKAPAGCRVVENEGYETSGPARSALMAVRAAAAGAVLLVHGDTVFGPGFLGAVRAGRSAVVVGPAGRPRADRVGANVEGGQVLHLTHGGPRPWLEAVLLAGPELDRFRTEAARPESRAKLLHELVNAVVGRGGAFAVAEHAGPVTDLDDPRAYRAAWKVWAGEGAG